MADNEVVAAARAKLRELLTKFTKGQLAAFNKEYKSIDDISFNDMTWATVQAERAVELNNFKERMK